MPYLKRYLDESKGVPLQDWWGDISMVRGIQRRGEAHYPTEKPEALLRRVIEVSSAPGQIVLDCFLGSGTTAAVAQKLGRRWIGCDINKGAIQTTAKRLQTVIAEQIAQLDASTPILNLGGEAPAAPQPAQLFFSTWRVNDYDLQIQHNEAVNLAAEHLGVERTRSDGFFDGVRGKALVKIIPFGHPLSPADLEEIRRELEARPDEDRPVTVVCLGMEHAANAWLEEWNRMRKGKDAVNRIEVIELRTDPRYGKWLVHQPASAKVRVSRMKEFIRVEIQNFISPTIIERLNDQAKILSPRIDDWRAMVDCVMIDPAYNGQVFNVALSDIPERKADFVQGTYELPATVGETRVAVKIIDMLGEEVLVMKEL